VDLLLNALACLRREGWDLELDVIGGGRLLPDLIRQARALEIDERVRFFGEVPRLAVSSILGKADLFVLCSDTEGLPRALIEAMELGLPCIGSSVGGIPELLPAVARFERGSLDSLVSTMRRFLVSPRLRAGREAEALERVVAYKAPALETRQHAFADAVAECGGPRVLT
jgi:glycosyltransferase involved in cell wall biosynthesis